MSGRRIVEATSHQCRVVVPIRGLSPQREEMSVGLATGAQSTVSAGLYGPQGWRWA